MKYGILMRREALSGRLDLNQRPLGPEPSALAGLSHAPIQEFNVRAHCFVLRYETRATIQNRPLQMFPEV